MKMLEADISKKLKNFDLDLRFEAEDGCLGILGASGCGKSMTLKAVAGFVRPDRGKIRRDGSVLFDSGRGIDLPPQKRQVGYLFQDYALFPNMTVAQNIEAGLLRSRQDKSARREQVRRLICQFRLEGLENQYPARISGGQQQRTALARIFASDARCILLDEPFSTMDSYLREEMQMELARMIREFGGCMVLVSHDRDEIYRLCGRTMIMEKGRNVICGQTQVLFDQPRKLAAARLTGCKNISRIQKAGDYQIYANDWNVMLCTGTKVPDTATHVGIRAHDILPAAKGEDVPNRIRVLPAEQVTSPFEWTLIFQNREHPGAGIWMKSDRSQGQIPDEVTIDPSRLLLLEE